MPGENATVATSPTLITIHELKETSASSGRTEVWNANLGPADGHHDVSRRIVAVEEWLNNDENSNAIGTDHDDDVQFESLNQFGRMVLIETTIEDLRYWGMYFIK